MTKRPGYIIISTPVSGVRRRLNFHSPYKNRVVAPTVRVTRSKIWANRPMNRTPRMYRMNRTPNVPKGGEGPCKVQSFEQRDDVNHLGICKVISDVTRGAGLTHTDRKRFCIKSIYILGKNGRDENVKKQNHTNNVIFYLLRDTRPYGNAPEDFGQIFNMFDNEPSTATINKDLRDRFQVFRKFYVIVVLGPSGMNDFELVKKFYRLNHHVAYDPQEAGKYKNHPQNALLLYTPCPHASNPVYATLKIRFCLYDAVTH
nr:AV1 [East African cassava mosaic virus]